MTSCAGRTGSNQSGVFVPVPRERWPKWQRGVEVIAAYRSREFLVQVYKEGRMTRLSISRTDMDSAGNWYDGITWDELQAIKRGCGYGDFTAVELYPPDKDIVNVSNMRHLWIIPDPDYLWRDGKTFSPQQALASSTTGNPDWGQSVA